jgi:hypothetical protein
MLAKHRDKARFNVREFSLPIPFYTYPLNGTTLVENILCIDRHIVLRLARNYAGLTACTFINIYNHSPLRVSHFFLPKVSLHECLNRYPFVSGMILRCVSSDISGFVFSNFESRTQSPVFLKLTLVAPHAKAPVLSSVKGSRIEKTLEPRSFEYRPPPK